jgi:hypothetical protein
MVVGSYVFNRLQTRAARRSARTVRACSRCSHFCEQKQRGSSSALVQKQLEQPLREHCTLRKTGAILPSASILKPSVEYAHWLKIWSVIASLLNFFRLAYISLSQAGPPCAMLCSRWNQRSAIASAYKAEILRISLLVMIPNTLTNHTSNLEPHARLWSRG